MKTEKRQQKHSAAKRLIPAAAMLLASATMLSTATYAWFTMNKEVKLTGLNMTATTGEGIEISLASVTGADNTLNFVTGSPSDGTEEKGWKSAVAVGDYYDSIGKIKPSSSVDAKNFFEATDAYDGGKKANTFAAVPTMNVDELAAFLVKKGTLGNGASVNSNDNKGYYVDIPVHIRTSKIKPSGATGDTEALYCKMILKNSVDGENNTLFNAVRVAFIPSASDLESTTKIFGVDKDYYSPNQAVGTGGTRAPVTVITDSMSKTDFTTDVGVDSGLRIPYAASSGLYGHIDFTLRVWLEGESTSCYDEKAGQSWKIDLAFSLGKFDVPPSP